MNIHPLGKTVTRKLHVLISIWYQSTYIPIDSKKKKKKLDR